MLSVQKLDVPSILRSMNIDHVVQGATTKRVASIASIQEAGPADLTFSSKDDKEAVKSIRDSKASVIICKLKVRGKFRLRRNTQYIFTSDPRRAFVRAANKLFSPHQKEVRGGYVSPTAVLASNARIGRNCIIGDYSIIGKGCVLGDNCIIHSRVTLHQLCRMGKNCVVQSGVTIGHDGFSYERLDDYSLEKFPHVKGVVIGDNVEIYSNTNIARGSLNDTEIGDGTRIDALVQIAHNVRIGRDCMLTAGTVVGGSATIGDCSWMGLNSTLKQQTKVGSHVIVGAGACVIRDVPDGDIVAGVPARSIKNKVHTERTFHMAGIRAESSRLR